MKAVCKLILAVSMMGTAGCATMFNGSQAPVTIRSEDPQAKIYVDDVYVGMGSATTSVPKKGNHTIRVSKEGCGDQTAPITKSFDATSLLGILLDFGIVSMLVVDGAATGAISDISPRTYALNPNCSHSNTAQK